MSSQELENAPIARLVKALRPCVVDIGARGGVDEDLLAIAWACSVYGFESEPAEAERMRQQVDHRWKAVHILPYAVAGRLGSGTLYLPESEQGASLIRHNPEMVDRFGFENLHIVRKEVDVPTVTLDSLHQSGELPAVDYMKIDIEGAELDVLKAGQSVLRHCSALKIETSFLPQRMSQPLIWDLVPFMKAAGFDVVDIRDIHRWRRRPLPAHPYVIKFDIPYSRGQLAQCDLIFFRQPDSPRDLRQMTMLVIVSAALGYFDYAVSVLRGAPEVAGRIRDEHGFDIEAELSRWARLSGRESLRRAIAKQLRTLVPQLRSLAGSLPYTKPKRPY